MENCLCVCGGGLGGVGGGVRYRKGELTFWRTTRGNFKSWRPEK